ncbi:MAG: hypothetical protein JSV80_06840, partial [Acidobacteriota bacterium]
PEQGFVFVWPEQEPVALEAGFPNTLASFPELASLGPSLITRVTHVARVGREQPSPADRLERVSRWLLLAALALVAGVLLLLLRRTLAKR